MAICSGIKVSDRPATRLSLEEGRYQLRISRSIHPIREDWDRLVPSHKQFLRSPYLSSLETIPPSGMEFVYILFLEGSAVRGAIYCQLTTFDAYESLKSNLDKGEKKWYDPIRKGVARNIKFRTLVCGNLMISGPHGYHFDELFEDPEKYITQVLKLVGDQLSQDGEKIQGFFVKDFPEEQEQSVKLFGNEGYHEFDFLPCMCMKLRDDWQDFDDYLSAMSSKYRVRARRAFKALGGIEKRILSSLEVKEHNEAIYSLYREVADSVDFNMAMVPPNYFQSMKSEMPDDFHIEGYFLDGNLVGFISFFVGEDELEAHFIGFRDAIQRKHQLYLNILYDLIRAAFRWDLEKIHFARTATEIKSSVGAVAHNHSCMIRFRNPVLNTTVRPLVRLLEYPTENWEQRHPFK